MTLKRWTATTPPIESSSYGEPVSVWLAVRLRPPTAPSNDKVPPVWVFADDEPSPRATAPTATLRRVAETLFAALVFPGVVFGIVLLGGAW